jgi:hypothetical membrane protein
MATITRRARVRAQPEAIQPYLLLAGVLSSLVYVFADVAGGLAYDGYSFTSQAISELMADGAPSEALVDPLFIVYDLLIITFGVGVLRQAERRLARRVTGAALLCYGVIGLAGPTLFEMQQRGAGSLASDAAHVLLTGVLSLLLVTAIGLGSSWFGKRFRNYSIATMAIVLVVGGLTAPFAARLAAGQPTPGFGIIERITIYAALLWIAVFSIALQRRQP